MSARVVAGQLLLCGFLPRSVPASLLTALGRGERGGVILFRRNLGGDFAEVAEQNRRIADAAPRDAPPLIAVDQEGGRVTRLGAPMLRVPPMRALGRIGDAALSRRVARVLGAQLAALGFTLDFAPVLDVDTCATNPVIGDRSFSDDPRKVRALGEAFAMGLADGGVLACAKHFPGHGDTTVDSHLDLPRVSAPRERLREVEIAPYVGLRAAQCACVMTAHVIYPALDAEHPATLSRAIVHDLLRVELGYDGLVVSDDLEMKAIADRMTIEESAVLAVRAGCDLLLVCSSEELAGRAFEALVREGERSVAFLEQMTSARARALAVRRSVPPKPLGPALLRDVFESPEASAAAQELECRGAFE
jgi:beta-N-acetylhexosaminidase